MQRIVDFVVQADILPQLDLNRVKEQVEDLDLYLVILAYGSLPEPIKNWARLAMDDDKASNFSGITQFFLRNVGFLDESNKMSEYIKSKLQRLLEPFKEVQDA